jgi:hypothetical protein
MGVVDRSAIFMVAFKEAMANAGWVRRILHVFQLLGMLFLMVLPQKLGLKKGKTVVSQVSEHVTQIRYGATSTNSYSITSSNKEVLVVTAPPAHLVDKIRPFGKIAAVLVLDANHETHISEFVKAVEKETGSRPVVIAVCFFLWFFAFFFRSTIALLKQSKSQRKLVEEAERVDEELETSAVAKRFGFQRLIGNQACREHCGSTDHLLLFKTPDSKSVLVGSCGFGNVPFEWDFNSSIAFLLGFVGAGLFRMYNWTFVSNVDAFRKTWREGIDAKPDLFLPQHGAAIKSNTQERMKKFAI